MEAPKPISPDFQTSLDSKKINFIEELIIKQENKDYKIQFGINDSNNQNEIIINVISCENKTYFSFQNIFTQQDFLKFSKIFSMYDNTKEIILFLKTLKYQIIENNDNLKVKFNIFLPNGESKLIELNLRKSLLDSKNLIEYLLEENNELKKDISFLKENNSKNIKEIFSLKEENKKLWIEIDKLKKIIEKINILPQNDEIDSKIISSKKDIGFILDYIKNNDKSFSFSKLNLIYRGSRDGDGIDTLHKLCDNKEKILIIIKSDIDYIFGGYCKIGFKVSEFPEYKIDNNCFLFSKNLKKIYPVVKDKPAICHIGNESGLCFYASLFLSDKYMKNNNQQVCGGLECKNYFYGLSRNFEINGGKEYFKCKEVEVFQLE